QGIRARRFRTACAPGCVTARARGCSVRRGYPAGDSRPLGARCVDQRRLHHTRPARAQGPPQIVGRRSHTAAGRPPAQVLCVAACRGRSTAAGVPRVYGDGRRRSRAAGDKVKIRPPWVASWLLSRRLRDEWREFVVGDLEEEFATRSGDSRLAARAWFWWQTIRCLAAPPPVRPNR